MQIYDQNNSSAVTKDDSVSNSISLYRIMLKAFSKSDIMNRVAFESDDKSWTVRETFFAQALYGDVNQKFSPRGICFYLSPDGKILLKDLLVNPQMWATADKPIYHIQLQLGGSDVEAYHDRTAALVSYFRLNSLIALSSVAISAYPEIKSKRLNAIQDEKLLIQKINANFDAAMGQVDLGTSKKDVYLLPKEKEKVVKGVDLCAQTIQSVPSIARQNKSMGSYEKSGSEPLLGQAFIVREPIFTWSYVADDYLLKIEDSKMTVFRKGQDWISDTSILGENLTINGSTAKNSSSGTSKSNQIIK